MHGSLGKHMGTTTLEQDMNKLQQPINATRGMDG
ncbi:hypothetical protein T12_14476 [Trichinella patagoniensis]|uniref:Uncharacterized protein n=1 Tax=Trichinella patagoniensis TaxID=990121 RepID=A0A0V0XTG0_9BILA|nr:hypothetical protein T12_14476 [Trichinella patagoniensis]